MIILQPAKLAHHFYAMFTVVLINGLSSILQAALSELRRIQSFVSFYSK